MSQNALSQSLRTILEVSTLSKRIRDIVTSYNEYLKQLERLRANAGRGYTGEKLRFI